MVKLMKLVILLALLSFIAVVALPAARRIAWDSRQRPPMQLSQGMQVAGAALNAHEGLPANDDTFYCLGAVIAGTTAKDGDWTFAFGSKDRGPRWVIVDLNGRVDIRKEAPEY